MDLLMAWMVDNKTSPTISSIILNVLWEVHHTRKHRRIPLQFQPLLRSQQTNPNPNRLSILLRQFQQAYFQLIGSTRSVTKWAMGLSRELIIIGQQMWEHRNSIKHSEESVESRRLSKVTNAGIKREFQLGPQDLPTNIRPLLHVGMEGVLQWSLAELVQWLDLVKVEREQNNDLLTTRHQLLCSFLTPPKK